MPATEMVQCRGLRLNAFWRDFKREKKEQYRHDLDSLASDVLTFRVEDAPLPESTATMYWEGIGRIIANAISGPICC